MIALFKETPETDGFDALERKMVRALSLHKEMKRLLEEEMEAGQKFDSHTLTKLTLMKNNCVNRFEYLVGAIRDQLRRMAPEELPNTCPRTLANRVHAIPGLTLDWEERLLPLARELEAENRALIEASRRNIAMLRGVMDRMWAVYQYTRHGGPV